MIVPTDHVDLSSVSDPTTSAIDRVFDFIDDKIDKVDRIFARTEETKDLHVTRHAKRQAVIDTAPAAKVNPPPPPPPSSTAIAVRRFKIIESIDASTGQALFIVTNGAAARAECSTRELAEKILRALETSP